MKTSKKILSLLLIIFSLNAAFSQDSCNIELSSLAPSDTNNSNWVVPTAGITCVSSNLTVNNLEISDGGTLVIKEGVVLTVGNIKPDNIPAWNSTIKVYGELRFSQNANFPMSTTLTVYSSGKLTVNSGNGNINFKGNTVNFVNNGEVKVGVLELTNGSSINTIDNQGTMTVNGNMNISGTSRFRNGNILSISQNFNNNANSVYVNCGVFTTTGFNLQGGKVYNTGSFAATGSISFGANTAFIENYGTFNGTEIQLGGGTSYVFNSGEFTLSNNFSNDGHLKGVTDGNYGKFTLKNKATINNGSVTGNLNFINSAGASTSAAMFNNSITVPNTVIFGTCLTCTVISSGVVCFNPDGTIPVAAICTQPGLINETPDSYTNVGMSSHVTQYLNWPDGAGVAEGGIPNGFLALDSNSKGFVISRVASDAAILVPSKGMLIYDIAAACVKLYNGTFWNCIEQSCNE